MTYSASEPAIVEAYVDQAGGLHPSRDGAIDANFRYDLVDFVKSIMASQGLDDTPIMPVVNVVVGMAKKNPDVVRVLLGDRDAT